MHTRPHGVSRYLSSCYFSGADFANSHRGNDGSGRPCRAAALRGNRQFRWHAARRALHRRACLLPGSVRRRICAPALDPQQGHPLLPHAGLSLIRLPSPNGLANHCSEPTKPDRYRSGVRIGVTGLEYLGPKKRNSIGPTSLSRLTADLPGNPRYQVMSSSRVIRAWPA